MKIREKMRIFEKKCEFWSKKGILKLTSRNFYVIFEKLGFMPKAGFCPAGVDYVHLIVLWKRP
jgi:hypothetical protein